MRAAIGIPQIFLTVLFVIQMPPRPVYAQQPYQYGGGWSNGRWVGGSGGNWSDGQWHGGDYGGGWRNGRFVGTAPPGNTYSPYPPTLNPGHSGCRKSKTKNGKWHWNCP